MLFHGGVEFLGQVVGYIRHPRLLLVGSADAALVFVGLLVVPLFGIFAVSVRSLGINEQGCSGERRLLNRQDKSSTGEDREFFLFFCNVDLRLVGVWMRERVKEQVCCFWHERRIPAV